MYQAWQKLLPGFEWISWKSFFLGLIEPELCTRGAVRTTAALS
jgi:hypothetical protein